MSKEVKFKAAERTLLRNGYKLLRVRGSHHYYTNGTNNVTINLKLNRMVWQRVKKENGIVE